ncbi:MAG TPA: diacylglycerol kinase family lipid kinase [Candidatus Eremiobacteraeota bacterium]|nr:diacylglycerol kinase family lipid kinase [Candidatus Eremiobacteraeota bacterium]
MNDSNICLIYNPIAGISMRGITKLQPVEDIIEVFSEKKISITIKTTTQASHATRLAEESVRQGYTHIVACGGDGTINEVVNGIVGRKVALGIIPLGTENILAKSMNVPLDTKQACRHFLEAPENIWDVGVANGRHFLIMSGIGLDARVVYEMEPKLKKAMGSLGFILKGAQVLFWENERKSTKAKIRFLDKNLTFETPFWLIVVGNLAYYGGRLKLALKADPSDGKLDVIVFPFSNDTVDIATRVIEVFTETHLEWGDLPYYTSTEFEIITEPEVYCQIDGELLGKTPVHYSIKPLSIRVKF